MLLSLGMAASVAPLTTTVMGAVEERHAGLASGVNNAVSRTAGLLSIAALGIVMAGVFARDFNGRLRPLDLPAEARAALEAQAGRLAAIEIPAGLNVETKQSVERAVAESFVGGFRVVIIVCAALALASALCAWLLIEGRARHP
jgi:hypothetical protein